MSAFDRLIEQVDAFIKKYYKNEMLKGGLLFLAVLIGSFLLVTGLEFMGRFNSYVRAVLFFGFLLVNGYIFFKYFFVSILKLFSFGKRINRNQAAGIIGQFFPQVSDRLLNTLQLSDSNQGASYELIRASVVQKANKLNGFTFTDAVDLGQNKRYIKWLTPLFLLLILAAVFVPSMLKQGTERVINFEREFVPQSPFSFVLLNNSLTVEEGSNITLEVKLTGGSLPEKLYLITNDGKFLMNWTAKNIASFELVKVNRTGDFHFEGNGYNSGLFHIQINPKSSLGRQVANLHYPAYLRKKDEVIQNSGDIIIPEGTEVEWSFLAKNTKKVYLKTKKTDEIFNEEGFKFKSTFVNDDFLKLYLFNSVSSKVDSSQYNIDVIKDAFPSILVNEVKDSLSDGTRFFTGQVSDDYGLSSLMFFYEVRSKDGAVRNESMKVKNVSGTTQQFDFAVDFRREELVIEDRIEYYFKVRDNDGVNGSKSSISQRFTYQLPGLSELNDKRQDEQEKIQEKLEAVLSKTKEFKKDVERLKKDINNSKSMDWKMKEELKRLQSNQENLQKAMENVNKMMDKSAEEKNQLEAMDPALLEKQKLIDELMNELMDDEMLDLLKKLEEMMENQDKEGLQNEMEKLDQNAEDQNKQLDRSLEMLKKLQVNEKIDDIEKELFQLAEDQRKLENQIEKKTIPKEEGVKKQEELNEKFDDLKKDMEEMKSLNEQLESPMDISEQKEQKESISEEMKEASENLQKGKESKAGENQNSAADEMEKMAEDLNQMQEEANQQQQGEDIEALRRILKSLMSLSFDQELVMNNLNNVLDSDPSYRQYSRKQRNIVDDTKQVNDSLQSLAKRQPKIASFIDKELQEIKLNHLASVEDMDEHRRTDLGRHQQGAMMGFNNLALMLNESLEAMQQQMSDMKKGEGSCSKPGGGKPKPGIGKAGPSNMDMKQMLKQQLEMMKKGKSPGGKSPGEGEGGMSPGGKEGSPMPGLGNKEAAKMAAQQSEIRRRLEEMRDELNKDGKGKGNQLNPLLDELEKQERDLINKNFSSQMITRQRDILTRLLESEKALMERGFEDKRESKSGKNENFSNQIRFEEYNKEKLKQIEMLRSVDPVFNKYYKDKANDYFNIAR